MALKEMYERWSDDRRVLFVRWVLIIFIGAVLTSGYNFYDSNQTTRKLERKQLEIDTLKANADDMEQQIIVLQFKVETLIQNQIRFDKLEDQYANPRILKDMNGNVLSINEAYYQDFMKPFGFKKDDYRNDVQFWGYEFAQKIKSLEDLAIKAQRPVTVDFTTKLPFGDLPKIDRKVTVNPLRDRYDRYFMFEISIFKDYK